MASPSPTLKRPGFGLPLEEMPVWDHDAAHNHRFPHAIADLFAIEGVTLRERRMLDFINQITDKPRWWEKINAEEILGRWRSEACGTHEQQRTSSAHLDSGCFEYVSTGGLQPGAHSSLVVTRLTDRRSASRSCEIRQPTWRSTTRFMY